MPIAIIIPARTAVPANLDSLAMENLANVRYMFNNPVPISYLMSVDLFEKTIPQAIPEAKIVVP